MASRGSTFLLVEAISGALREILSEDEQQHLEQMLDNVPPGLEPGERAKAALMIAADFGRTDYLEKLLDGGVDVDLTDDIGGSALHHAIAANELAAAKLLISRGATAFPDKYGRWPSALAGLCQVSGEMSDLICDLEADDHNPTVSEKILNMQQARTIISTWMENKETVGTIAITYDMPDPTMVTNYRNDCTKLAVILNDDSYVRSHDLAAKFPTPFEVRLQAFAAIEAVDCVIVVDDMSAEEASNLLPGNITFVMPLMPGDFNVQIVVHEAKSDVET